MEIKRNLIKAFSLVEMLIVIALLSVLMAMLFPVFAEAREKSRMTTCASNLRQIGTAMALYAQDYDGLYPYGADPVDKYTDTWGVNPVKDPVLATMPLLHDTLRPYTTIQEIWRCASDVGLDVMKDQHNLDGQLARLDARPTAYVKFGTSYVWRTELAFRHKLFATGASRGNVEVGPAELTLLNELTGEWHGEPELDKWVYNGLMGDGHVMRQTMEQNRRSWALSLD